MKPIILHPEADEELDIAIGNYEQQLEGLGVRLQHAVERTCARIQQFPLAGLRFPGTSCRFAVVRRFPFVLYYKTRAKDIWIMAVAHARRRPGYWRKRRI